MWRDTYVFGCHVKLKNILNNCKLKKKKKRFWGGGHKGWPATTIWPAGGFRAGLGWLNHPQGPKEIFF
jgi:hypothetical protein